MKKLASIIVMLAMTTVSSVAALADTTTAPNNSGSTKKMTQQIIKNNQKIDQIKEHLRYYKIANIAGDIAIPISVLSLLLPKLNDFAAGMSDNPEAATQAVAMDKKMYIESGVAVAGSVTIRILSGHEANKLEDALNNLEEQNNNELAALNGLK